MTLGLSFAAAAARAEQPADADGFRTIFDGKTLAGWDGDPRFWRVEDGCIVGQTTKEKPAEHNTFLIYRGDDPAHPAKPADFEIKIEFRMPDDAFANSGVQIRSWEEKEKWRVSGYQPDMDWKNEYTGICYGENFRGILANRGQKTVIGKDHKPKVIEQFATSADLAKFIKKHDWNEYDITARSNHITEKINGHLMCEVTDEDTRARKDGIIALQIHVGEPMKVQFRNVRLKEFKSESVGQTFEPVHTIPVGIGLALPNVAKEKIVFIAGGRSHGYAEHEHKAGCYLLAKLINENVPAARAVVYQRWPADPSVLDDASSIVIYCDGGEGHLLMKHLDEVDKLMKKGVGLCCIHYAVEIPKGEPGNLLKSWIGGYFETFWSVNPHWTAHFEKLPDHPVAQGVKPFTITDEWYFNMRFADDMKGVTPILAAIPPDEVHRSGSDAHGANPTVFARKGQPEHMAWVYERPGGGRGFGITGAHVHWNWGNDNFRKVVLNAIIWTAGLDVPDGGVSSKTPTFEELQQNIDKPKPRGFDAGKVKKLLEGFNK
jgi:hypothetical protein